ncbi:DUF1048 domain-containing protein [Streptomyces sp. NPDC017529]|uniref:DUF1048 domain-containing protein n=1 Tax=Streptomyces sp. NPDC017529 TaxID=3365000 RepID=UPI003795410C
MPAGRGQSVHEVLGDDIERFCAALAGEEGARNHRDRWREHLNRNVAKNLADGSDPTPGKPVHSGR